jgi:opacity protein-like surface antigen
MLALLLALPHPALAQRMAVDLRATGATATQRLAGTDLGLGFGLGGTLSYRIQFADASPVLFRIEAGATYKHIEIESQAGGIVADSGHSLGFEAGGGVVVRVGPSWRLTPTVRFRSLSADFELPGVTTKSDMRYGGLELGLTYQF